MGVEISLVKPAFSSCDHCIVFASDDNYMALTAVAIQSIIENNNSEEFFDFLILHAGVSDYHQKRYNDHFSTYDYVNVRFVDVTEIFNGLELFTSNRKNFSREAYFRIAIPWVLDASYRTALYFDGDMIARHDISSVFQMNLENNLIAAVKDYWGICNCYMPEDPRRDYRISLGLTDIDHFFQTGTLLFNLSLWRENYTLQKVLATCEEREWLQHDQDVFNVLCREKVSFLSSSWGMMEDFGFNRYLPYYLLEEINEYEIDPIIVQFGGYRKPYIRKYAAHDIEFWRYAAHTPYFQDLFEKIVSNEYRNYIAVVMDETSLSRRTEDGKVSIGGCEINIDAPYAGDVYFTKLYVTETSMKLEGILHFFRPSSDPVTTVKLRVNNREWICPSSEEIIKDNDERLIVDRYSSHFTFDVPLGSRRTGYKIKLFLFFGSERLRIKRFGFLRFFALSGRFENEYYMNRGWMVTVKKEEGYFVIKPATLTSALKHEVRFLKELYKSNRISDKKAVALRLTAQIIRPFLRKPVWLVSDRILRADDNGEVFFRYLMEHHSKEIHAFFLLSSKAEDYEVLKKVGPIVEPYSKKHKILSLIAEWSISSQTDAVYRDPFWNYGQPYRSMLRKTRFVFLQHGVISNDMTRLLNKDGQQFDGFVTSTVRERDSILKGDYGYTSEEVWMTGLPRFDRLKDRKERIITVMPTWRAYLTARPDNKLGRWILKEGFGNSDYVVFYRELMENTRLRQAAKLHGYRIQFKVHPAFLSHTEDFQFDKSVSIVDPGQSYADIYATTSLVVTDYSSSIYDFVYLKKPIVYCQFDKEDFFSGKHKYDAGDYDYQAEGFGEVTTDLESTIDTIIGYMENDCVLHEPYKSRIENAFPSHEANHCEQLYRKIIEKGKY